MNKKTKGKNNLKNRFLSRYGTIWNILSWRLPAKKSRVPFSATENKKGPLVIIIIGKYLAWLLLLLAIFM
jgi:hypothetical protein